MTPEEFVRMRADMNRRLTVAVGIWISEVGVEMLEEVRALSEGWAKGEPLRATDEQLTIIGQAMNTFYLFVKTTIVEDAVAKKLKKGG